MIRRLFWMAFGVGLGATTAVVASRWTRKQAKKAAPATIAREAKGGLLDLSKLVTASVDEGRRAMDERERELRKTYGVDEDLRGGTRRSGGVRPPVVVGLPAANQALGRDPEVLPDVDRLIVVLVHGHPQSIELDPVHLRDELEPPRARFGLEVVPEREVAEHLEQGEMAIGSPDVLDVVCAEALLDRRRAGKRRLDLTEEVRDELLHARAGEQESGLGCGQQRRGPHAGVCPLLEKAQEGLSDLLAVHDR